MSSKITLKTARKISDKAVLEAYLSFQRDVLNGDGFFCRKPYQRLMKRHKIRKEVCQEACKTAVERGFIKAPDDMHTIFSLARTDCLITKKGYKVLGIVKNDKPSGPQLLIEGWKWK